MTHECFSLNVLLIPRISRQLVAFEIYVNIMLGVPVVILLYGVQIVYRSRHQKLVVDTPIHSNTPAVMCRFW